MKRNMPRFLKIFLDVYYSSRICITSAFVIFYICSMKLIAIIFSVYMLGLNLLPCSDNDASIENGSSATIISTSNVFSDLDHSHSKTLDTCTPFCTCHCCHVHNIDFGSAVFRPVTPQVFKNEFIHISSLGEEPVRSLLDPPRV